MARVLVYEYTCSSRGFHGSLHDSLADEGRAMLIALAGDLVAASQETFVIWNNRLGELPLIGAKVVSAGSASDDHALLARHSRDVDWTLVIAPETGGALAERCRWIESAGGRLLGCSPSLIDLLSDKHLAAEHLTNEGVNTPRGRTWRPGETPPALPCPAVVKPRDGAGAERTFLVEDTCDLYGLLANYEVPARVEEYVGGVACSVSFLCGPRGCHALLPTFQRIEFERYSQKAEIDWNVQRVSYRGGRLPLPKDLSARAISLGSRAMQALPRPLGYIGVDLILGDDDSGRRDFVIEINPRLTTSYVGLRVASRSSLAQAMLDVAGGQQPSLSFNDEPIEFEADGSVRLNSEP